MREIKFRAWDKEFQLMRYLEPPDYSYGIVHLKDIFIEEKFIPMQFTGLFDRNDKEIYEGDILGGIEECPDIRIVIKFEDGAFGYDYSEDFIKQKNMNKYIQQFEILGNIYMNPELLKKGDN